MHPVDGTQDQDRALVFWRTDLEVIEKSLGVDDVTALPLDFDERVPGQGTVLFDRIDKWKDD